MGTVHAKERDEKGHMLDVDGDLQAEKVDCYNSDTAAQKQLNLEGIRARVDKVHVDGVARTKDDVIIDSVQDLFQATDFQDVVRQAHKVRGRLERLGCFRNIGIFIDTSRGPGSTPNGFEVTFHVKELKRIIGGVNTLVGNNEGSLVLSLRMPNMFGRGEKLQAEYSYGSKKTSSFMTAISKPLRGKYNPIVTASVFQQASEWPWSGYKQLERGVMLDLGFISAPYVKQNIQWEGAWRDISPTSRGSAFQVREESGPSLKSSVKHILSIDVRNACIFPTSGSLVQLTTELAGLGGNVGFLKNELLLQGNLPLTEDCVLQVAAQGGILNALSDDKTVNMCDLFYLGGPLSLRGFQMRGVGRHSDGNSLGAHAYWATALHLYTPLPFRPGQGGFGDLFRTHFFVNAGNIGDLKFGGEADEEGDEERQLMKNTRVAYGFGLAMRLGQMARVELNYCFPFKFQREDDTNPGLQFGVGMHFL